MTETTSNATEKARRLKQGRSPAYPGITLKKALEQARALYDKQGKYAAPLAMAYDAWGFKPKSSGARETRAAMRYFGLISVEGEGDNRKVKLTDPALRVLLDEREDQSERQTLIRDLALRPTVHKRLREQFPEGIVSDASAEHFLVFEEGYNKQAAAELVAQFKETASYAGIFKPGIIVDKPEVDEPDDLDEEDDTAASEAIGNVQKNRQSGTGHKVKVMEGERVVFTEETNPQNYLKLIASGEVDETMLDALEDYVKRQKKRLGILPDQNHPKARII
ncbi:hypothetical protein [Bradyrhizobium sp. HKCCYLS2033]|uniref:hypothetical protein n=1 Tax=Bradyrhizobium sp. HKCCYLS2033 TaxID=3420739 RepID=UPI003EC03599